MFILEFHVGEDTTPHFAEGASTEAIKTAVRQEFPDQGIGFSVEAVRKDLLDQFPALARRYATSLKEVLVGRR
jgi:hypothetical protein